MGNIRKKDRQMSAETANAKKIIQNIAGETSSIGQKGTNIYSVWTGMRRGSLGSYLFMSNLVKGMLPKLPKYKMKSTHHTRIKEEGQVGLLPTQAELLTKLTKSTQTRGKILLR